MFSSLSTSSAVATKLSSSDAFKSHSICCLLTRRSQGFHMKDAGVLYRKNMGILRKLVCQLFTDRCGFFQESTTFKNVWTTHSTSPIAYQSGKIYFDNYRCCVSSVTPEPRIIYQMPACPKSEKIEDALLLECPVGEVLPNPSDYKPSLAVLTAHNWLFRLCASTGEILEKVHLASHCKFRYLSWDTPQEVMTIKSAQHKLPPASQQSHIQQSVLFFLAVFRVLPLSFIGMLELDKKIFGNSMTDAAVSHTVLIVTHSTGRFRLYSFQAISEQFMVHRVDLGHEYTWNDKVGIAKNGIQDMKCCSLEPDWIFFHPDSSGRMVHVGPNLIKVLKLKETENDAEQQEVTEDFIIKANRENNVNNSVTVTASGRVVKKRFNVLDDDPEQETFKIVDYEDELNLLSIVAVTQIGADGTAHLDFHCNEYGTRLKSIPLVESWDVTYSHEVYFDRNVVLHIEQKPNRIFSCYVYQMICSSAKEDKSIKKKKGERRFCKKLGRTFEYF
ncbi:DDB1- and CUL4-associated factor 17 [Varanus komodoensis]|nr:DDB1- and CUL4-associated factor 17 [Varanus komodoensis]